MPLMGVYEVKNIVNNKRYIGSSTQLKRRQTEHFSELKHNRHPNKHIQADWIDYGSSKFVFNVLEIVKNKNDLLIREGYWVNRFKSDTRTAGYNIHGFDENGKITLPQYLIDEVVKNSNYLMGSNHPNAKLTESDIIDINNKADQGVPASVLSKIYNIDTTVVYGIINNETWQSVERVTAKKHHHDKKLTEDDVRNIKLALHKNASTRELADKYCVHLDTIYSIKVGINWSHILPELDLSESHGLPPKRKKLDKAQVVLIKRKLQNNMSIKNIASEFNVSTNTIYSIRNEEHWADVII